MFNGEAKKVAMERLESSHNSYKRIADRLTGASEELFSLRQTSSVQLIKDVEAFINSLANSPKEFDKTFAEYKTEVNAFDEAVHSVEVQELDVAIKTRASTIAGVSAGIGTAAFAPTAAMAIATTFGTASTGVAISSLSGAAASSAALAWLGGGALAVGGGGMSAGSTLLAASGPVGWGIGIAALIGGGVFYAYKSGQIAENATGMIQSIEEHTAKLTVAQHQVDRLCSLTVEHVRGTSSMLTKLKTSAPADYAQYDSDAKATMAALINHIRSLSKLINETVS